jgi:two-component system nitrogen regulation sensor histidine kinase NtrY
VIKEEDIVLHLRQTLVLEKEAHTDIEFVMDDRLQNLTLACDAQQIRQAFTNLVQNGIDSIHEKGTGGRLKILMTRDPTGEQFVAAVMDSGLGLPKGEESARLTEPYVTHKARGTGLGLAIVKKIMEDHKGRLVLGAPEWVQSLNGWEDLGGATVSLILPIKSDIAKSTNVKAA